jgi:predicted  nucleic acid-binding Zn-ribbon protein
MSALAEIQTMIEERVAQEPALAGTFHDLYQRVVTLKAVEQQLEKDHHDLQQAYKDLFVQYSAQTGELARTRNQMRDAAETIRELNHSTYDPQRPLVPCVL